MIRAHHGWCMEMVTVLWINMSKTQTTKSGANAVNVCMFGTHLIAYVHYDGDFGDGGGGGGGVDDELMNEQHFVNVAKL